MEALRAVVRSLIASGAVTPDAAVSAARELEVEAAVCRMLPEVAAGTDKRATGGDTARSPRPKGGRADAGGSAQGNAQSPVGTGARWGAAQPEGQRRTPGPSAGSRGGESEAGTPTGAGGSDMLHYQQVRAAKGAEMARLRSMVATLQDELRDQEGRTELIMSQVRCLPARTWCWPKRHPRCLPPCVQNSALKEQIRELERSLARQRELGQDDADRVNVEHLKNVVVGFMTAASPHQREPLAKVIAQMLKLGPNESQKVMDAVKGGDAVPSGSLGGWLWGGSNQ